MNIGELDGVKIILSPETYAEAKKQKLIKENKILNELQQQLDKYKSTIDKIKEYITTRTPSDIGISGNKPKKYYTLSEDEVDYILELLEEADE